MLGNYKDKDFSKALEDSLYVRIREALFGISGSVVMDGEVLKQDARIVPTKELIGEEVVGDDFKEIIQIVEDVNKVLDVPIEKSDSWSALNGKENGEIVDADNEEIVETVSEEIVQIEKNVNKVYDIPIEEDDSRSVVKSKMNAYVRSDVRNALETIERVISMVKEYGYHSLMSTSNSANEESHCIEKGGTVDSNNAKLVQVCMKNEVSVSSSNILMETSEETGRTQNFR